MNWGCELDPSTFCPLCGPAPLRPMSWALEAMGVPCPTPSKNLPCPRIPPDLGQNLSCPLSVPSVHSAPPLSLLAPGFSQLFPCPLHDPKVQSATALSPQDLESPSPVPCVPQGAVSIIYVALGMSLAPGGPLALPVISCVLQAHVTRTQAPETQGLQRKSARSFQKRP